MLRSILLATLVLGGVALTQPTASANPPGCANLGCGGFCFKFLGLIHQHGPLVNYGPYSGYYPFEPYGPWNSQLQYTGPGRDAYSCGSLFGGGKCGALGGHGGRCGNCGSALGLGGLGSRLHGNGAGSCGNCAAWGNYANSTFGNILNRTQPRNILGRCQGCGDAPAVSVPSCSGCAVADVKPELEANPIVPTGYRINDR